MGTSIKPKYAVLAQWIVCHPTKVRDLGSNPKRGAIYAVVRGNEKRLVQLQHCVPVGSHPTFSGVKEQIALTEFHGERKYEPVLLKAYTSAEEPPA